MRIDHKGAEVAAGASDGNTGSAVSFTKESITFNKPYVVAVFLSYGADEDSDFAAPLPLSIAIVKDPTLSN